MTDTAIQITVSAFIGPLITGLVIQFFVKKWAQEHLAKRLQRRLILISMELAEHQDYIAPFKTAGVLSGPSVFPLSTKMWDTANDELLDLSADDIMELDAYYRQIYLLNKQYSGVSKIITEIDATYFNILLMNASKIALKYMDIEKYGGRSSLIGQCRELDDKIQKALIDLCKKISGSKKSSEQPPK